MPIKTAAWLKRQLKAVATQHPNDASLTLWQQLRNDTSVEAKDILALSRIKTFVLKHRLDKIVSDDDDATTIDEEGGDWNVR